MFHDAAMKQYDGLMEDDFTIQTCWDAERYDFYPVGIQPGPKRFCTPEAREPNVITRAINWSLGEGL